MSQMFTCECKRSGGWGEILEPGVWDDRVKAAQSLVLIIFEFTHSIGISSHSSAIPRLYTLLREGDAYVFARGENSSSPKYLSTRAVVVLTLIGSGGEHVFLEGYIPFRPSSGMPQSVMTLLTLDLPQLEHRDSPNS